MIINSNKKANDKNNILIRNSSEFSGFNFRKNNFYYDYLSHIIEPIRLPTQINMKDV